MLAKRVFTIVGIVGILLFAALRGINIYGDAVPWSPQRDSITTFLSFMNVTKYPPSLLFCLITLGIMFLLLAVGSGSDNWLTRITSVYGKVPMFYFLLHFFLIHGILLCILLLQGFHWTQLAFATGTFGRPAGASTGLSLSAVYLIWIAVVAALYKPCQWYGSYKTTHQHWWLRYL